MDVCSIVVAARQRTKGGFRDAFNKATIHSPPSSIILYISIRWAENTIQNNKTSMSRCASFLFMSYPQDAKPAEQAAKWSSYTIAPPSR